MYLSLLIVLVFLNTKNLSLRLIGGEVALALVLWLIDYAVLVVMMVLLEWL